MADVIDIECEVDRNNILQSKNMDDECEPPSKRMKLDEKEFDQFSLEQRLNDILRCGVCFDLPNLTVYQCTSGDLMCSSCLSSVLAESRSHKVKASCPKCSCEISRTLCCRNLVVEKAISELPISCPFCRQLLPRSSLSFHKRDQCQERPMQCQYASIGCEWKGPFHSHQAHEATCTFPDKTGHELIEPVLQREETKIKEVRVFKRLLDLLSCENVEFVDVCLRSDRSVTDDPATLSHTTKAFKAHGLSWGIYASNISSNQENTPSSSPRTLAYKLVLETKPRVPIHLSYFVLKGPYGSLALDPIVHEYQFSEEAMETPYHDIPCCDPFEASALVKLRSIRLRLALIQVK